MLLDEALFAYSKVGCSATVEKPLAFIFVLRAVGDIGRGDMSMGDRGNPRGLIGVAAMGDLIGVMACGVRGDLVARDSAGLVVGAAPVEMGAAVTTLRESFGFIALEANILACTLLNSLSLL